jgi:PKD repeat protein
MSVTISWSRGTALSVVLAIFATACAGRSSGGGIESVPAIQARNGGLPSISDLTLLRDASVSQDESVDGRDTYSRSSNAVDSGTFLDLLSETGGLAWGVWAWEGTGRDLASLDFDFSIPASDECFVALANYDSGAWDWSGPYADDASVPLDDAVNRSPEGLVMCAVVAWDGDTPSVCTITLRTDTSGNVPPKADLQADPLIGHAPLAVSFDASGSDDSDGSIVDYEWDFNGNREYNEPGEEAAAQGNPTPGFTYGAPGIYRARLRVTDDGGIPSIDWAEITVADPLQNPIANFVMFPPSGATPLAVDFDAGSSLDPDGTIVDYEWDLDGNAVFNEPGAEADARGLATAHNTYYASGSWSVSLRVTDNDGLGDSVSEILDVSGNESPVAAMQASPSAGVPPLDVTFDGSASSDSDGTIVKYEFDFDEGAGWQDYGGVAVAAHTYSSNGSYDAKMRVTDNASASNIATVVISVDDFQITDLSASKWTHHQDGGEAPATLTCTTNFPADSYEWTASVGGDPAGSDNTAAWSPAGSPPLGKATITCTAHMGTLSDTASIDLIITDLTILTDKGVGGAYTDFNAEHLEPLANGGSITSDVSFSSIAAGKVVLAMAWESWDGFGKQELPGLEALASTYYGQGFRMISANGNTGDTNAAFVQPYFTANGYNNIDNFYGGLNGNGGSQTFWSQIRGAGETGIPYHVLLDMDGKIRSTFYGGHGAGTETYYAPYIRNLLGLL